MMFMIVFGIQCNFALPFCLKTCRSNVFFVFYKAKYVGAIFEVLRPGLFSKFVDRKFVGLMPKYSLLAGDTKHVSIFSLHKVKMSKQRRFIL